MLDERPYIGPEHQVPIMSYKLDANFTYHAKRKTKMKANNRTNKDSTKYYGRIRSQLNIHADMRLLMRHHGGHYNLMYSSSLSIVMSRPRKKVMETSK